MWFLLCVAICIFLYTKIKYKETFGGFCVALFCFALGVIFDIFVTSIVLETVEPEYVVIKECNLCELEENTYLYIKSVGNNQEAKYVYIDDGEPMFMESSYPKIVENTNIEIPKLIVKKKDFGVWYDIFCIGFLNENINEVNVKKDNIKYL